jgi:chromosome partitioning protein
VPEERIEYSIADALLADPSRELDAARLLWEVARNLHLAPATMRLAALEAPGGGLHERPDKDRRLAAVLEKLAPRFDRCLIDCPPTLGLLTFNALRAARECIIPVETSFFAFRGAEKQWTTIQRLIDRLGRPIICHILPTLHKAESRLAGEILAALQRQFAGQIVPVVIREHDVLREAASFGQPLIEYAPDSEAQRDFTALCDWLEDHAPLARTEVEVVAGERPDASAECGPGAGSIAGAGSARLPASGAITGEPSPAHLTSVTIRPFPAAPPGATDHPDEAASAGSRAAELVRRVRDIALRNSQRAQELEGELSAALEPASGEVEATIDAIRGGQPPAIHEFAVPPSVLVSIPVAGDASTKCAGAADRTPPSSSRDLPPEASSGAGREAAPAPTDQPGPPRSGRVERLAAVFGARQTSQGVLFVQPAEVGGRLFIAGEFNGWSPTATPMRLDAQLGVHQALVAIPPGEHTYRLIIDGRWQADAYNPRRVQNSYGEPNSVVVVAARARDAAEGATPAPAPSMEIELRRPIAAPHYRPPQPAHGSRTES